MAYGGFGYGSAAYGGRVEDGFVKKIFLETIALSDKLLLNIQKVISALFSLASAITSQCLVTRVFTEAVSITDKICLEVSLVFSEALSIASTFSRATLKELTEIFSIVDSIAAISIIIKIFAETIALTESLMLRLNGIIVDIWDKVSKIVSTWTKDIKKVTIWRKTPRT